MRTPPALQVLAAAFLLPLSTFAEYTNQTLTDGKPFVSYISKKHYAHYRFDYTHNVHESVSVVITPIGNGGDPDLYINVGTEKGYPNRTHNDYHSFIRGRDAITIPSSVSQSTILISVYAYSGNTRVSVLATYQNEVALLDGVPQEGHVERHNQNYYTFNAASYSDVVFAYSTYGGGSVMMYISKTGEPDVHDLNTYEYHSWSWFHPPHTISRTDTDKWPANNIFHIAMYGVRNSTYSLMVRSNDHAHTMLRDGIPMSDSVALHEWRYYKFQVDNEGCNVTVQLTPISGDPDLFVSKTYQFPNYTHSDAHSQYTGTQSDSVTITNAAVGNYYVGVRGWESNSTFTIFSSSNCGDSDQIIPVSVSDGVPVQGSLERGDFRLYKYTASGGQNDITFSVAAQAGDPDLYINRGYFSDPADAELSYSTYGSDFVVLGTGDPHYCADCDYYVMVSAAATTTYTLTVKSSLGRGTLQNGIAVDDQANAREYEYYELIVEAPGQDVTVSVTDYSQGDPDLYISCTDPYPTKTNYTWSSKTIGADSITIAANDPNACGASKYYVAVYAFSVTHYSIIASWGKPIVLQDGQPQTGSVTRHATQYYKFVMYGVHDDVTVSVSTTSGKVTMMVSETELPLHTNSSSYQFFIGHQKASKTIVIRHGENMHCQMVHGRLAKSVCTYYVGLYGYTEALYTITASSNHSSVRLLNGMSIEDHISALSYEYFFYDVIAPNMSLAISLTPLEGDPDLYMSSHFQFPNRTQPRSLTRESRSTGGDSIYVTHAPIGRYYIGVYGFRYSRFTLMATEQPTGQNSSCASCTSMLFDGQPQHATLAKNGWRYFSFDLTDPTEELEITMTRSLGDPDLYLGLGFKPTRHNYTKHSMRYGSDFVSLRNPPLGKYYIGVFAYTACRFEIVASTGSITHILQTDIPVRGMINKHEREHFTFETRDLDRDLSFILTPLSGDPDLNVTFGGHVYRSRYWLEDSVTIPHTDIRSTCTGALHTCHFNVVVYGYTASIFTLLVSSTNSTSLQDGVPQAGSVHRNEYKYYRFECPPATRVMLSANPSSGRVAMYVGYGDAPPTESSHLYKAPVTYSVESFSFIAGENGGCDNDGDGLANCVFTIGIRGMSHASSSGTTHVTQYSLLARTERAETSLQNGVAVHGWAMRHTELFYRFDNPTQGSEIVIQVTKLTGDPDLYVATSTPRPSRINYQYHSMHFGNDLVVIPDANATSYYIGVYAFQNSTYTISALIAGNSTSDVQTLVDGIPQFGYVARSQKRRYRLTLDQPTELLTISLTVDIGDPDLNVTIVTDSGTSHIVKRHYGNDMAAIPNAQPGSYNIDVLGYRDSRYTIVATTADTEQLLVDGHPILEQVPAGQRDFFKIWVDRTDMDLTVTVTAFSGDPDLYVADFPRPTEHHYNYTARRRGEDSITIPHVLLRRGFYHIAVYGYRFNTSYQIMATFSNETTLADGVPQFGQLSTEAGHYYRFTPAPHQHTAVRFSLSLHFGAADMFISTQGAITRHYTWRTHTAFQTPTISVPLTDHVPGSTYYILVHAFRNASYSITASTTDSVVALISGQTRVSSGFKGEFLVYNFDLSEANNDLEVSLTPISGKASLSVSSTSRNGPWQWTSGTDGLTLIDIPHTDPHFRTGSYYIGVNVTEDAQFGLTAYSFDPTTQRNDTGTLLTDGIPQLALVKEHKTRYYRFEVDGLEEITVSVTPRYGDPDLYITLDGSIPAIGNPSAIYSVSRGDDQITVKQHDLVRFGCATGCTMRIAINAYARTLFSVTATTSNRVTFLEPGQTFTGEVEARGYREFAVYIEENSPSVVFECVPVTSGDPDLYIAEYPHPNVTHHQLAARARGRDSITVSHINSSYLYVSVYGFGVRTSFRLTAILESTPVTLVDGDVQNGFVSVGHVQRYVLHDVTPPATLMLHNFDGNAVMYASHNNSHPSAAHHQWTTELAGNGRRRGVIDIPASAMSPGESVFIGVVGTVDTYYSLLGSSGAGSASLIVYGQPMQGHLAPGATAHSLYRFYIDSANSTDVSLLVTTFSGALDVYVKKADPVQGAVVPSATNYDYKGTGGSGQYQAVDVHGSPGAYYVAVYHQPGQEYSAATFSITAMTDNVMLQTGVPQLGRLRQSGSEFFVHIASNKDLLIELKPSSDRAADIVFDVYISTNASHIPDPTHHDTFKRIRHGEALVISQIDSFSCRQIYSKADSCVFYIGVFPYSEANVGQHFSITASTPDSIKTITNGQTNADGFNASVGGHWAYYDTYVPIEAEAFIVDLEPCVGETDLYMANNAEKPTESQFTWSSHLTRKADRIEVTNRDTFDSSFYIGVHLAKGALASYRIRSSIKYPGRKLNGTQQPDSPVLLATGTVSGLVELQWKSSGLENVAYYSVYWLDSKLEETQSIITYTPCGLSHAYDTHSKHGVNVDKVVETSAEENVQQYGIKGLESGKTYAINVVAHMNDDTETAYATSYYTHTEGGGGSGDQNKSAGALYVVLGVGIPVFVICAAIIGYLVVKNRKLTQELEVEMHDVPIRLGDELIGRSYKAGQSAGAAHESRKYSRLLSEVEDDEKELGMDDPEQDFSSLPEV